MVRDWPREARWLNAESCNDLSRRLEREQQSIPATPNLRTAFKMPSVIWLCVQYFCWSMGIYGFVLWLPTMIKAGMSKGIEIVGLLSGAPYLAAIILMLIVAYYSDRTLARKRGVWPFLVTSGFALLGSYVAASYNFSVAYAFLILAGATMYAPYGPFFAIIPEMLPENVVGEVLALINSCGALGGFVGTWLVGLLQAITGSSRAGFLFMSISLMIAGAIVFWMRPVNQRQRSVIGLLDERN